MKTKKLLLTLLLALTGSIATWADATTYYLKLKDTNLYFNLPGNTSDKVTLSSTACAVQFVTHNDNTYLASADGTLFLGYGTANTYDLYAVKWANAAVMTNSGFQNGYYNLKSNHSGYNGLAANSSSEGEQVYGDKQWPAEWEVIEVSSNNTVTSITTSELDITTVAAVIPSSRGENKGVGLVDGTKASIPSGDPSATAEGLFGSYRNGQKAIIPIYNQTEQAYIVMFDGANGAAEGNGYKMTLTDSEGTTVAEQDFTIRYTSGSWDASGSFAMSVGTLNVGEYTLTISFHNASSSWTWTANVIGLRFAPAMNAPANSCAAISLRDKLYLSTTNMDIDSGNEYAFGSMRNNNYAVLGLNNTQPTDYSVIFESATNSSDRSIKVDVIKGDGTNELSETKSITAGSDWNGWHTYYVEGTLTEGAKSLKITGLSSGDNWTANVRNIHVVPVQTIPTEALSLAYGWKESGTITIGEAIGSWQNSGTADYRVKVSEDGDYLISFNASNNGATDSKVTFSLVSDDGTTAFTSEGVAITKNGDWNTFLPYTAEAKNLTAGTYTLKLSGTASGWIANINQIAIQKAAAYTLAVSKDANIGTFVAPYDVKLPEGVTAYTVSQAGNESITLTEVATGGSTLTANTPVILKTDGLENTLTQDYYDVITGTENANSDGYLTGCYSALALPTDGTAYVLQWNSTDSKAEFRKVTSATTATAGRCYLKLLAESPAESPARLLVRFSGDETTAISEIANGMNNDQTVYNLRGQKVMQPQKGIYIIHGKKTIVK